MNMCNHQARTVGEAHAAFRDINGSAGLPLAVKVAFGPIGSRLFPHDGCLALWCVTIDLTTSSLWGIWNCPGSYLGVLLEHPAWRVDDTDFHFTSKSDA